MTEVSGTKPRVLIWNKVSEEVKQLIAEHCELIDNDNTADRSRERLLSLLADADGLLQSGIRIDAELLGHAPQLKAVSSMSVGYDNFDIGAMKQRGIIGTHTPYVLDDTVADLVLALMLSAARRVPELDKLVKDGRWGAKGDRATDHFGLDVHHRTVGLIGMGRIGEAIAKRAALGFDMKVLYTSRSRKPHAEETYGAEYRMMEQLLQESDFVVVMTPYTKETYRMIRKEHFAMMKRTAVFINAARGQVVDEEALVEALREKVIYAAGLDVFEQEPIRPDHPLLCLPNAVTLPHIGSATSQTRSDMAVLAANNLIGALLGDRKIHIVPELQ